MTGPLTAGIIALGYVGVWMIVGEALNRRGLRQLFCRKLVHIGASGSVFIFAYAFDRLEAALAVIVLIAALAVADHRTGMFRGIQSADERNLGTVWFWTAMLLAVAVLWDQQRLMVASVVPMAVGDPLAGLVGATWGKRQYEIGEHRRTVEGSLTFVISSFILTLAALLFIEPPPEISIAAATGIAVTVSLVGAAIEAVSRWGIDNLAITVAAVLTMLIVA